MGINDISGEKTLQVGELRAPSLDQPTGRIECQTLIVDNLVADNVSGLSGGFFPEGTIAFFHENAAPVGWTKSLNASFNNSVIDIADSFSFGGSQGAAATTGHVHNHVSQNHSHSGSHRHFHNLTHTHSIDSSSNWKMRAGLHLGGPGDDIFFLHAGFDDDNGDAGVRTDGLANYTELTDNGGPRTSAHNTAIGDANVTVGGNFRIKAFSVILAVKDPA